MTDIERIRRDLVACRDIPWSCSCVEPEQLAALVAEVERLRGERASMDEGLQTMVPNDKATAAERAAVVAWLEKAGWMPSMVDVFRHGEHRRKETP